MNNTFINEIKSCIPLNPKEKVSWSDIDRLLSDTCFSLTKKIQQNPVFHGEGDVYTHTQMVCQSLMNIPEFYNLSSIQQTELFLSALLHDIGKVKTTKIEDGQIVSPHHSVTGSQIVRDFLWNNCNICGTKDLMVFRETVCALIRYHMLPMHILEQENAERKLIEIASVGELATDFSINMLCILSEADVKGRIANDMENSLDAVRLTREIAKGSRCLYVPYVFADEYTKHVYLSGRNVSPEQSLYDDTWGEIIVMSGVAGTGKDTWIQIYYPYLPMISLDDIRKKLKIKPTDNQGKVIQQAYNQAREYLRKHEPFVWNATNLTKDTRAKLISLAEQYHARVRLVYLETDKDTQKTRNENREDSVPDNVIAKMISKTVPPAVSEAQIVEWNCV